MNHPIYEYETQRIALPKLFLSERALQRADEQRREILEDYAARGWRLVQVIQPFGYESLLRVYYELIFERKLA